MRAHLHHDDHPESERDFYATYTVKTLIAPKLMGNGSGNVTTWQYQNTGSAEAVCRSMVFSGNAGATGAVSVEIGVTGATAEQDQRIIDGYQLTANVPSVFNGWYTIPVNDFLQGFADSATVTGGAFGLTSV